jgi:hypothetical protein
MYKQKRGREVEVRSKKRNDENRQRQSLIETQVQKIRPPQMSEEEQSRPRPVYSAPEQNPRRKMRKEKSVLRHGSRSG